MLRRLFCILALAVLLAVPAVHSFAAEPPPGALIPHLTTGDFLRRVGGSDLPVLVQFDASWCPYCRKMQPFLDKFRDAKKGSVEVYKVNYDADPDLVRSYEVQTLPTLIVFYQGRIVGRSDGAMDEPELFEWMEAVQDDVREMRRKKIDAL
ncbi:MAG TPA: thioredoxin family protein [Patescibacteria group bacterium]|nr:thioredoxin family protein [Patescibacteria group bacterium]